MPTLGERIINDLQSKWPITLGIFITHNSIGFRYRLGMGLFLVIPQATITPQGFQEKFIKAYSEIVIMMLLSDRVTGLPPTTMNPTF
jgi:hypothetical protein